VKTNLFITSLSSESASREVKEDPSLVSLAKISLNFLESNRRGIVSAFNSAFKTQELFGKRRNAKWVPADDMKGGRRRGLIRNWRIEELTRPDWVNAASLHSFENSGLQLCLICSTYLLQIVASWVRRRAQSPRTISNGSLTRKRTPKRHQLRSPIGIGHVTTGNPSSSRIVIAIVWLGTRTAIFCDICD